MNRNYNKPKSRSFEFIALSLALGILFMIHVVGLGNVLRHFGIGNILLFSLVGTLFFPLAYGLESLIYKKPTLFIYETASIWLGILGLLFVSTLLVETITLLFSLPTINNGFIVVGATTILTIAALFGGTTLIRKQIVIHSSKIKENIKLIQLTDLHLHGKSAKTKLKAILKKISKERPDIIVITGDLLDTPGVPGKTILEPLNRLKVPVLYITGNHERKVGMDVVEALIKKTKLIYLKNEAIYLKGITFIGIEDAEEQYFTGEKKQVEKVLPLIKRNIDTYQILLYHRPVGMEYAQTQNIDLMLCGHTHGGQLFPFTIITKGLFPYLSGLFHFGQMRLYVSQGTGMWGPRMRLGTRNEITVFHLAKE